MTNDSDPTGVPPPDIDVVAKTDHAAAEPTGNIAMTRPVRDPGFVAGEDFAVGDFLYADPGCRVWKWRGGGPCHFRRAGSDRGPSLFADDDVRAGDAIRAASNGGVSRWTGTPGKTGAELLTEATAELESAMEHLEDKMQEVTARIGAVVNVLDQTTIVAPAGPRVGMVRD